MFETLRNELALQPVVTAAYYMDNIAHCFFLLAATQY